MNDSRQYRLDFTGNRDELIARIAGLRELPIAGFSRGRVDGVVEILQRLVLLARSTAGGEITVAAQVSAIAARITARKSVSERTVRNWRADAVALGLLAVDYVSREYGGHAWNRYRIDRGRLAELIAGGFSATTSPPSVSTSSPSAAETGVPDRDADFGESADGRSTKGGGNGRKRAETISALGAETISALGAETISALTIETIDNETNLTPNPRAVGSVGAINVSDLEIWRSAANRIGRLVPTVRTVPADRDLVARLAVLVVAGLLDDDSVEQSLEAIRLNRPRNAAAYLQTCLANQANSKGFDLPALLRSAVPPLAS